MRLRSMLLAVLLLFGGGGCTAMQELAALRRVVFAFDHLSDVRLAGIPITERSGWSSLSVSDAARLGAAAASGQIPMQLTAHVRATNPAENAVSARMLKLDWKLFVADQQMLAGSVDDPVAIAPGASADVGLAVQFDLLQLSRGGARDLFDTALGIAGYGTNRKELRFELVPTIDTRIGPIAYPSPITIRR